MNTPALTDREACCALVPAFDEGDHVAETVRGILAVCPNVVVVDDGSRDETAARAEAAGATVLRHETNRGKGAALRTGLLYAEEHGFEFVITMDADGQHDPRDLPRFLETYRREQCPVLVGNRMDNPRAMPIVRRLTNRFMSWLLSRRMGQRVPDTQSGYRLYRNDVFALAATQASGFAAESEVLLNIAARGIRIRSVPIRVIYREETSQIRPVRDTIRFLGMLRRCRKRAGAREAA